MPLNFNPYPYRDPREENDRFVQQLGQGIQNIGNTIVQNRENRKEAERQAILSKYLAQEQARKEKEHAYKYGSPIDPNAMAIDSSVAPETAMTRSFGAVKTSQPRNLRDMFEEFRSRGMKPSEARPEFMSAMNEDERKQFQENANPKPQPSYVMQGPDGSFIPLPPGTKPAYGAPPKPTTPPSGYRYTPTGDLEVIPGGPADIKGKVDQNKLNATMDLYESARKGLVDALAGTNTGPIMGRLPDITSAQQTAEAGVAAMAPVLKQLFRVAGEGVFTDRDQQLLLDMIPTRKTNPGAIPGIMQNIDNIVRAKVGAGRSPGIPSTMPQGTSEKIRVRNRQTGQTGSISPQYFDPNKYERL